MVLAATSVDWSAGHLDLPTLIQYVQVWLEPLKPLLSLVIAINLGLYIVGRVAGMFFGLFGGMGGMGDGPSEGSVMVRGSGFAAAPKGSGTFVYQSGRWVPYQRRGGMTRWYDHGTDANGWQRMSSHTYSARGPQVRVRRRGRS